jgi:outer membrane protein OmpA-like peptidoglycan-associated protein
MRSSRSLPAIAAIGLATAAVVPASCSSVSDGGAYDASDASVADLFGTTSAALTTDTVNSSGSSGLRITLDGDGRLAIRDRMLSPQTDLFKGTSSTSKAAIGVSVGGTLCHASLGAAGFANGGVVSTGAGTEASPYVMTLTAECAGVPVAVVLRYKSPQAFVDVRVQVNAPAGNASTIRVLAAFEPDFQGSPSAETAALQGQLLAAKEASAIYAGFANPGPVWSRAYLGAVPALEAALTPVDGGDVGEIPSSLAASASMAVAAQWDLGAPKGTRFVTFRFVASSTLEADADQDSIPDIAEKTLTSGAIDTDLDLTDDDLDADDDGDGIPTLVEAAFGDTDGDGTPDYLDADDDNDGIATSVETTADTDGDSVQNYRDRDSDGDGILDSVEHAQANGDADGVSNYLDLDSDDDGIIDAIEAGHGAAVHGAGANAGRLVCLGGVGFDGMCDALQASDSFSVGANYTLASTDGDALPNFVDVDSDGDGLKDGVEAGRGFIVDGSGHVGTTGHDADGLLPAVLALGATAEGFAPAAGASAPAYASTDTDGDGISDATETTADFDADGIPNFRDLDSDNDGIFDAIEGATASVDWDSDGDGVFDVVESGMPLAGLTLTDGKKIAGAVGANGIVDAIESADTYAASHGVSHAYTLRNTDGTDQPDYLDTDDDNDGIATSVEGGTANTDGTDNPNYRDADDDNDGIPTLTERTGDLNGDGVTSAADHDVDSDGVANHLDLDSDNDGITDLAEGSADAEGDGRPNFVDLDSDGDGVFDAVEAGYATTGLTITSGRVQGVVTGNGFLDALETGDAFPVAGAHAPTDTDGDGVRDFLDRDSDNDGLLDADESGAADGDADGVPNRLDLDSDGDGVTDAHEAGFTTSAFTISLAGRITGLAGSGAAIATVVGVDGFVNALQVGSVDGYGVAKSYTILNTDTTDQPNYLDTDDDNDGLSTSAERSGDLDGSGAVNATDLDLDGDLVENHLDLDSDNDGLTDALEGLTDTDGDGVANFADLDSDADGVGDVYEAGFATTSLTISGNRLTGAFGSNGIRDALETTANAWPLALNYTVRDTDSDGHRDALDRDADNDGLLDGEEGRLDTDSDGVANFRDLDSDNDGIVDAVEAGHGAAVDTNARLGCAAGVGVDGLCDSLQASDGFAHGVNYTVANTDGDSSPAVPDFLDTDSDNDTVFDADEAERGFVVDAATGRVQGAVDGNGLVAAVAALGSTASGYAPASSSTGVAAYRVTDTDGDGIPDGTEGRTDADGDGVPNYRDLDSDNDGILDVTETASKFLTLDSDGDGVKDVYEAGFDTSLFVINADGRITGLAGNPAPLATLVGANGVVSTLESADTYAATVTYVLRNTNGSGQPDYLDADDDGDGLATSVETSADADADGLPNYRDLDSDNDGLLDSVEGSGDLDADGQRNFVDLDADGDGLFDVVEAGFVRTPFTITAGRIVGLAGSGQTIASLVGANGLVATLETGDAFPAAPNYTPQNTDGTGGIDALDTDDDEDGIATSVETDADNDGDGVANHRDLDSDADGILDATELANARGVTKDSDADGTADYWDDDADGDGIFDAVEAGHAGSVDPVTGRVTGAVGANGVTVALQTGAAYPATLVYTLRNSDVGMDAVPDYLDLDSDQDGILDGPEGTADLDSDGTPNYRDLDADGDGVRDATEAGHRRTLNSDGRVVGTAGQNGLVNTLEDVDTYAAALSYAIRDTDSDGKIDPLDTDDDGDGILTLAEGTTDSDSDSYANYLDLDSDNDGINDSIEGERNPDSDATPNYLDLDSDGDGFFDAVEAGHGQSVTPQGRVSGGVDANGRPLAVVNLGGYTLATAVGGGYAFESNDSDGDGIPDNVEGTADPDGDGIPNNRDRDSDNDGILDATEGSGDLDDDGVLNYLDLDADGDGVFDVVEAGHGRSHTSGRLTGAVGIDGYANALQATDAYTAAPNYTLRNTDGDAGVDYVDTDDDGDGIPTKDETAADLDGDGVANYLDLDVDSDGIGDADETAADPDGDGTPSYRDLDSDGDGISDIDEAGHASALGLTISAGRIVAPVGANGFVDALENGDAYPVVRKAALRNTDSDVFADYLDTDDDNDGIPTVTETAADRDADGVPNCRDLDSDNDGLSDVTEKGAGATAADTDADGTPDFLDADSDEDGLADVYEAGHGFAFDAATKRVTGALGANGLLDAAESADTYAATSTVTVADTDGDGVADYLDRDADNDGVVDAVELAGDPDSDGRPSFRDLDADGDGVFDATEAGHGLTIDAQGRVTANVGGNGFANALESADTFASTVSYVLRDTDGDAIPNVLDLDDDGDGIPTATETTANSDGDALPNYLDLDSDNDGISDAVEGTRNPDNDAAPNFLDLDSDGDGIFDALEAGHGRPVDPTGRVSGGTDATGTPSTVAALGGYTLALASNGLPAFETGDTDGDGLLDGAEGSGDTDGDGLPNFRDRDSDNDGILDSVEGAGDVDGDGVANYLDLDADGDGVFDATEAGHGLTLDAQGRVLALVGQNGYANDLETSDAFSSTSSYTVRNADGDAQLDFLDTDDDGDGIATTTETATDTDGDGVPNYLDLDSDGDGLPDAIEGLGGTDGDGVPNYLDLDSDGDGLADAVEAGFSLTGLTISAGRLGGAVGANGFTDALETGNAYPVVLAYTIRNTDGDARADYLDDDDDNDGIRTALEGSSDDDGDTLPNHRDLDSDNDGLSDAAEKGSGATPLDTDGDGVADFLDTDSDQDGIFDAVEAGHGYAITAATGRVSGAVGANGLVDAGETNDTYAAVGSAAPRSTDSDDVPDHLDRDSDADGIPDSVEGVSDPDADGVPSYRDLDADGDGIVDAVEAGHGRNVDGNGRAVGAVGANGLLNAVEQADTFTSALAYALRDTDADGTFDYLDLDDDADGIATRSEGAGDADGDGVLDYRDLDSDNDGLTDRVEGVADSDGDGTANYLDLDSDADGLADALEAGHGQAATAGRVSGAVGVNGLPDAVEVNAADGTGPGYTVLDTDADGIPNFRDIDDDNDGLPTSSELASGAARDTDGDGAADHVDLDADGDGIFDAVEAGHGVATDGDGRVLSPVNAFGLPTAVASAGDPRAVNYTITTGVGGAPTFLLTDSDGDGILDSVERGTGAQMADTDGDGVPDLLDRDSDQDGIPDSVERDYARGGAVVWDTDNDTIPDFRDLDSDGDGISDAIEAGHGRTAVAGVVTFAACSGFGVDGFCNALQTTDAYAAGAVYQVADTDNDLTPDFRDDDSDGDGITDVTERGPAATPLDTDGDGVANYKDLDSDGDTIPDAVERVDAATPVNSDADALPDYLDVDSDNDGILDSLEVGPSPSTPRDSGGDATKPDYRDRDSDGDGIWDAVEAGHGEPQLNGQLLAIGADGYATALRATPYALRNFDGDSLEDYRDADSDNDGVSDATEAGNPDSPRDSDRDGKPDYRDEDDDADGLLSALEVGSGTTPSNVDGDSLPDYLDLDSDNDNMSDAYEGPVAGQALPRDTDGDGIFDFRDADSDGDEIPDADERGGGSTPADTDGDGVIDARDRDTDGDGILDRMEGSADADGDGQGNYRDVDADSDGIPDVIEAGFPAGSVACTGDCLDATSTRYGRIPVSAIDPLTGVEAAVAAIPAFVPRDTDRTPGQPAVPDYLDLDSDDDGIPDAVERGPNPPPQGRTFPADSDSDGTPDYIDLDSDGDSIPDATERRNASPNDQDRDGIPDYLDTDSDNDGIDDRTESGALTPPRNSDDDPIPDYLDTDSDNDTIADAIEIRTGTSTAPEDNDGDGLPNYIDRDSDADSIPDIIELATDVDGDGRANYVDVDSDNDGIVDRVEAGNPESPSNVDGDGLPDYLDLDSDGDGIYDVIESGLYAFNLQNPTRVVQLSAGMVEGPFLQDGWSDKMRALGGSLVIASTDVDTVYDFRDLDSDNDGVLDALEIGRPPLTNEVADTDGDKVPDFVDTDSDGDEVPDSWERGTGAELRNTDREGEPDIRDIDSDNDGIHDYWEFRRGALTVDPVTGRLRYGADALTFVDTDSDGVLDIFDLDSDNDGIPDDRERGVFVESAASVGSDGRTLDVKPLDWDNDGTPDFRDVDSDGDGIYDVVEGGFGFNYDRATGRLLTGENASFGANGLLTPFEADDLWALAYTKTLANTDGPSDFVQDFRDLDSDQDGITDANEATGGLFGEPRNTDGTDVPDYRDLDSDQDGLADVYESGAFKLAADRTTFVATSDPSITVVIEDRKIKNAPSNGYGLVRALTASATSTAYAYTLPDSDGDNVADFRDRDSDNDGLTDDVERGGDVPRDRDGDGIWDVVDIDSDNDRILDVYESGIGVAVATLNGRIDSQRTPVGANGFADVLEQNRDAVGVILTYTIADTDGDLVADFLDEDSDNDGILDLEESGVAVNSFDQPVNTDGVGEPDYRDLDADEDGIYDVVEAQVPVAIATLNGRITAAVGSNGRIAVGVPYGKPINTDRLVGLGVVADDTPDFQDLDSDGDGIFDAVERGSTPFPALTDRKFDFDGDGVGNYVDADSDDDGIPDVVEARPFFTSAGVAPIPTDTDRDGAYDFLDDDSDNDSVLDKYEGCFNLLGCAPVTFGGVAIEPQNSDADALPDFRDLDSDEDGQPDSVEVGVARGVPVNTDGNPTDGADFRDVDSDDDQIGDAVECPGGVRNDKDGDGKPNCVDVDADGDGIGDVFEARLVNAPIPSVVLGIVDTDADGEPDYLDTDSDGDTIADADESGVRDVRTPPRDTDGDVLADFRDKDSDNDGLPDGYERGGLTSGVDTDDDGTPDYRDTDTDGDGIADAFEARGYLNTLANGSIQGPVGANGIPDAVEVTPDSATFAEEPYDTDLDGTPDFRDGDSDGDGVDDEIEQGGGAFDAPPRNTDARFAGGADAGAGIGDAIPDFRDSDADNDTIPDVRERVKHPGGATLPGDDNLADTDADGVPDYLDLDSDNDGILDREECWGGVAPTGTVCDRPVNSDAPAGAIGDDKPDYRDTDSDDDTLYDAFEVNRGYTVILTGAKAGQVEGALSSAGDGTIDVTRAKLGEALPNHDGACAAGTCAADNVPDYRDTDSDGDGIGDRVEGRATPTPGASAAFGDCARAAVDGAHPFNFDCDGAPDYLDADSDNDGVPDRLEHDPKQEGLGIGVAYVALGQIDPCFRDLDSDDDTVSDAIEVFGESAPSAAVKQALVNLRDTNRDGTPDMVSLDSDDDGHLDRLERSATGVVDSDINALPVDTDGDGVPDYVDYDSDNDGIRDTDERTSEGEVADSDKCVAESEIEGGPFDPLRHCNPANADGFNDFRDGDSDGDGLPDAAEAGHGCTYVVDGGKMTLRCERTRPDGSIGPVECKFEGTGFCDLLAPPGDGRLSSYSILDTDSDGYPDFQDRDADNDELPDATEAPGGKPKDSNGDGVPDHLQVDSTGEGVNDGYRVRTGGLGCSTVAGRPASTNLGAFALALTLGAVLRRARRGALTAALVARAAAAAEPIPRQQEGGFDAETFRLPMDAEGILDVETARKSPWLDMAVHVMQTQGAMQLGKYVNDRLTGYVVLVDQRQSATLSFAMPVWKLELGATLPLITGVTRSNGSLPDFGGFAAEPVNPSGLGDARVAAKYVHCRDDVCRIGWGFIGAFVVPTGNTLAFNGEGVPVVEPEFIASSTLGPVRLAANLAYRVRLGKTESRIPKDDVVIYRAGASYRFGDGGAFGLDATVSGQSSKFDPSPAGEPLTGLEATGAASYGLGRARIFVGAGQGILAAYGVPQFRGFLTFRWAPLPPPPDRDGDSVPDATDACPDIGGTPSQDPAKNGCPVVVVESDKDNDGFDDTRDACPLEAGVANEDPMKHGCPPPPPDADADGVPDERDACPLEPGVATDDDRNGCPPPPRDPDGDGIDDTRDACPDEPGTANIDPLRSGCRVGAVQGALIALDPVAFAAGSAELSPGAAAALERVALVVEKLPSRLRYRLEGHADEPGSRAMRRELSLKRARAVQKWLDKRGFDPHRFAPMGFGGDRARPGEIMRRVEFAIVAEKRRRAN